MGNQDGKRKRIAVIGGGASAMTAVYNITKTKDWRQKYDITIYQMGWRIGGKGASGRNMAVGKRIEEHGLHIWFGFYNNAFNFIRDVYDEYTKIGNTSPLKSWSDAFKPQNFVPLFEKVDDKWSYWGLDFPTNDERPGGQHDLLPFWEYIHMALDWLHKHLSKSDFSKQRNPTQPNKGCLGVLGGLLKRFLEKEAENLLVNDGERMLKEAMAIIKKHEHRVGDSSHPAHGDLHDTLDKFLQWLKKEIGDVLSHDATTRHLFILLDLGVTMVKGFLKDKVAEKGLDSLNDIEFKDWLRMHGAAEETVNSTLITALYDVGFAYNDGDISKPTYEAGSAIRIIYRLGLTYKGAFMWKMQAGMGDTIFTPVYKVFDSYKPTDDLGGITFKFFHKLKRLELSKDKKSVKRIHMEIQAHVKGNKPYDPFVTVNDIPCWPNEPDYSQLEEGEKLKPYNLESFWTPWEGEPLVLEKDEDYDIILLGTPIATLQHHCAELIDANPKWLTMLEKLQTTQTQAYQLWLKPSLKDLGWNDPSPVSTSYAEPVDTWADMPQLIVREEWPEGFEVGDIAYFCGVMKDADMIPPPDVHSFPESQQQRVKDHLTHYVNNYTGLIWPKAVNPDNPKGLDFNVLVDLENRKSAERLNGQFWRANIDPSERYTLTNVGSSKYRLESDQTDAFSNLYLVGDWIQNNFNYGCIECCAMSGILAARAITGEAIPMSAEKDMMLP